MALFLFTCVYFNYLYIQYSFDFYGRVGGFVAMHVLYECSLSIRYIFISELTERS